MSRALQINSSPQGWMARNTKPVPLAEKGWAITMKKISIILLSAVLVFSMAACNGGKEKADNQTEKQTESVKPTEEAEIATEAVTEVTTEAGSEETEKDIAEVKDSEEKNDKEDNRSADNETASRQEEKPKQNDEPEQKASVNDNEEAGGNQSNAGMLGMHGTKASNIGVSECDLLIAIGVRFSDRITGNVDTFAKNAKIIHIDVDDAEIDKNVPVDLGIVGDAKDVIEAINLTLTQQNHPAWMKEVRTLKDRYPLTYDQSRLTGPYVIEQIDNFTDSQAIITTEVGQNQMWAAQYYHYRRPRQFLSSGGLGTMGYGLGAAIGAKYGCPNQLVFNIAGDGCFRMNLNELATASRYNIPIIEVVLNNHVLGMVRQWQTLFYGERYSATVLHDKVDFCKVAEGLGCKAIRVTKKEEVMPALQEAVDYHGPVVIECIIDDDDKVFPMVAPGSSIAEVFDEADINK